VDLAIEQGGKLMKSRNVGRTCVAATMALGLAVAASSQERTAPEEQVTITGCVQSEADYRKARDAGKGGVAGTGVGAANEFVLVNASTATGAPSPTGTSGSAPGTMTGVAYELTGPNEGKVSEHVGKRVEIMGKLKASEVGAAGNPTGGTTAGKPPAGVDVASKDLKLRELDITTVKEVSGTCPRG
jgi:hypothetical protein